MYNPDRIVRIVFLDPGEADLKEGNRIVLEDKGNTIKGDIPNGVGASSTIGIATIITRNGINSIKEEYPSST